MAGNKLNTNHYSSDVLISGGDQSRNRYGNTGTTQTRRPQLGDRMIPYQSAGTMEGTPQNSAGAWKLSNGQQGPAPLSKRACKRERKRQREAAAYAANTKETTWNRNTSQSFRESESPRKNTGPQTEIGTSDFEMSGLKGNLNKWASHLQDLRSPGESYNGLSSKKNTYFDEMQDSNDGGDEEDQSKNFSENKSRSSQGVRGQPTEYPYEYSSRPLQQKMVELTDTTQSPGVKTSKQSFKGGFIDSGATQQGSMSGQKQFGKKLPPLQSLTATEINKPEEYSVSTAGKGPARTQKGFQDYDHEEMIESEFESEEKHTEQTLPRIMEKFSSLGKMIGASFKVGGDSQGKTTTNSHQGVSKQLKENFLPMQEVKKSTPSANSFKKEEKWVSSPAERIQTLEKNEKIKRPSDTIAEKDVNEFAFDNDNDPSEVPQIEEMTEEEPSSGTTSKQNTTIKTGSSNSGTKNNLVAESAPDYSDILEQSWVNKTLPLKSFKTVQTGEIEKTRVGKKGDFTQPVQSGSPLSEEQEKLSDYIVKSMPADKKETKTIIESQSPVKRTSRSDQSQTMKGTPSSFTTTTSKKSASQNQETADDSALTGHVSQTAEEFKQDTLEKWLLTLMNNQKADAQKQKSSTYSSVGKYGGSAKFKYDLEHKPVEFEVNRSKVVTESQSPGIIKKQTTLMTSNLGSKNGKIHGELTSKGPKILGPGEKVIDSFSLDSRESFDSMETGKDDIEEEWRSHSAAGKRTTIMEEEGSKRSAGNRVHEEDEETTFESNKLPWGRTITKIIKESRSPGMITRHVSKSTIHTPVSKVLEKISVPSQKQFVQKPSNLQSTYKMEIRPQKLTRHLTTENYHESSAGKREVQSRSQTRKSRDGDELSVFSLINKLPDRRVIELIEEKPTPGEKGKRFSLTQSVDPEASAAHSIDELDWDRSEMEHQEEDEEKPPSTRRTTTMQSSKRVDQTAKNVITPAGGTKENSTKSVPKTNSRIVK